MKVELVKPQGYCAGVLNAINLAKKVKENNPNKNIYVLGMLVHNKIVIEELNELGITTIEDDFENIISRLNSNDIVIFTAHGHDEKLDKLALAKGLETIDCTCPIVKRNLDIIKNELNNNHQIIYIGQKDHKETKAALSISNGVILYDIKEGINYSIVKDDSPLVINQTTLNFLSLERIHNEIKDNIKNSRIQNEICSATRLRQEAILKIDNEVDLIIIVGDRLSSNSNKLYEIAKNNYVNKEVLMVENLEELKKYNLKSYKKAAISSGASTPLEVINEIVSYLENDFR